ELLEGADTLFAAVINGKLHVPINHAYALKDAAKAHIELESRATTGAAILRPQSSASFRDGALAPDLRCAIAHRGIPRFRVRCGASPRNDGPHPCVLPQGASIFSAGAAQPVRLSG